MWSAVALLALALALFAWWSASARPQSDAMTGVAPRASGATSSSDTSRADAPRASSTPTPDARAETVSAPHGAPTSTRAPSSAAPSNTADAQRFNGTGRVRGSCDTPAGVAMPQRWTVVLEPSRSWIGSDHAVARRVDQTGTTEFTIEDVPFGGYDVRCEAEGMNGRAVPVLVERGSSDPYVMLQLTPAGVLDGELVAADLEPLEDVLVALEPLAQSQASRAKNPTSRAQTRTDASGRFHFDPVLDGEYRLLFGAADNPLSAPRELAFQAPRLSFPRVVIADLCTLVVRVNDEHGLPVQGARVHGNGSNGGAFEGETDASGVYRARHLRSGRVRVRAERVGFGSAFQAIDFGAAQQRELALVLRPQ